MHWINTKGHYMEVINLPIINNGWLNHQGQQASFMKWLNERKEHWGGTIIHRYTGQLLQR